MNNTITTKKNEYEKYFTPNTAKWLENKNMNLDRIYKGLTDKNFKLTEDEEKIKKMLNQNRKVNSEGIKTFYYKPSNTNTKVIPVKEPELVPVRKQEQNKSEEYKNIEKYFGPKIANSINKWAMRYNVDPYLLTSIMIAEHSGIKDENALEVVGNRLKKNPNHYAASKSTFGTTSHGLMQFTEETLEGLSKGKHSLNEVVSDYDLSIMYSAKLLSYLNKKCNGNFEKIVFSYNAGGGTLSKLEKEAKEKNENWIDLLESKLTSNTKGRFYVGYGYIAKANRARDKIMKN